MQVLQVLSYNLPQTPNRQKRNNIGTSANFDTFSFTANLKPVAGINENFNTLLNNASIVLAYREYGLTINNFIRYNDSFIKNNIETPVKNKIEGFVKNGKIDIALITKNLLKNTEEMFLSVELCKTFNIENLTAFIKGMDKIIKESPLTTKDIQVFRVVKRNSQYNPDFKIGNILDNNAYTSVSSKPIDDIFDNFGNPLVNGEVVKMKIKIPKETSLLDVKDFLSLDLTMNGGKVEDFIIKGDPYTEKILPRKTKMIIDKINGKNDIELTVQK